MIRKLLFFRTTICKVSYNWNQAYIIYLVSKVIFRHGFDARMWFCWLIFYVSAKILILVTSFVTNISNLSPTHLVSDIRRQHRCNQLISGEFLMLVLVDQVKLNSKFSRKCQLHNRLDRGPISEKRVIRWHLEFPEFLIFIKLTSLVMPEALWSFYKAKSMIFG